jgi:hypothetical protein
VNISSEFVIAVVIVTVLIGLAAFFGWQQWQAMRRLKQAGNLHPEDRRYQRMHAGRVFVCCVLMIMVAGMVGGWYVFGLEGNARELGQQAAVHQPDDPDHPLDANQQRSLTFFTFYWILAILLLLAMVYVAFMDLWAVRRFGLRQIRQLQADRRAMLERQIALMRTERNGHQ